MLRVDIVFLHLHIYANAIRLIFNKFKRPSKSSIFGNRRNHYLCKNDIIMNNTDERELLLKQMQCFAEDETDSIAIMANAAALLAEAFDWHWIGFYRVDEGQLVLGPFQGPVACTRIGYAKGVCGTAWAEDRVIVVPDVEQFPGHIACSSLSKSEIVVPIHAASGEVCAELDIDSVRRDDFNEDDKIFLERFCRIVEQALA